MVTDLFGRGRLRRQDSASKEFVETFLQSKVRLYEKQFPLEEKERF